MRPKHLIAILVFLAAMLAVTLALTLTASPARAGGVVSICDETYLRAALDGGGAVTAIHPGLSLKDLSLLRNLM